MNIKLEQTAIDSIHYLIRHERWYWKAIDFCRYDLRAFFKNLWYFRRELWKNRNWDSAYSLDFMRRSLILLSDRVDRGYEIDESRLKKVKMMKRAIELIDNIRADEYLERAEAVIGELKQCPLEFEKTEDGLYTLVDKRSEEEKEHNKKVFDYHTELMDSEWNELFDILRGQGKYIPAKKYDTQEESDNAYYKWFDGSDMRSWWT